MTLGKLFHELLGLGLNWEVIESRFERASGTVFLEIRETSRSWDLVRCPADTGLVFCYGHTEVLTWRHLNIFQHRCEITCRLPRGKCRRCGHVFRVRPPWEGLSTHFTKEFEAFALLLMREMPMSKVAEVVGETDTRLWRMLFRQVDAAYAEADFSNVGALIAFRIGYTDAEVMTKEIGKTIPATALADLERYEAVVKLLVAGANREPFRAKMLPPLQNRVGRRDKLIALSRERFAMPRKKIEAKLKRWMLSQIKSQLDLENVAAKFHLKIALSSQKKSNKISFWRQGFPDYRGCIVTWDSLLF